MIKGFKGRLLTPGDAGYDDHRRIWNEAVQARPSLLARCADTDDVALAIGHAHDRGLPLTVRAGGHNFAGRSLADGGVVIDVRDLNGIAVDLERRVAHLGAGLRWGQVDPVLQEHGLATTGGSVSKVGVAGFSLGTGLGWLGRLHGLAGDNLTGATIVTADGAVRNVGQHTDPDLYWALRGAGTGLGVVTELRMRLFPLVRPTTGMLIHRIDNANDVLWQVVEATADAPSHLNWAAVLTCAPPVPALPGDVQGRPVFLVPVFSTSPDGVDDPHVQALRRIGRPLLDTIAPTDFCTFQTSTDDAAPDGTRWDVRSEWLTRLDGPAIDHAAAMIEEASSPLGEFLFRPLGGAIAAPDAPDTPFSYRPAAFMTEVIANWPHGDGAAERAWTEKGLAGVLHLSAGGPDVNHLGLDEDPARARAAYSPATLNRLAAIKKTYDPANAFTSPPWLAR
ncbi:FAD-binding oxidoreductase [Actinomadura opuntiae]|uniref:FAD-binding oxidoreductase n=1 Tax=Actinomadura sp. OS1-43 TaxID=604315 RepID=UPI00255AC0B6|nr:FAD-binding oxidoreductase [Actinomadura sp. OS1-43]MDL4818566.1 FAD-binding oxidoreductase [Actinomadura sp. OS1-43]